jgi:branched-subunit amino acid aminotransferase/4-amino-4-deoxychorismate lyase
MLWVRGTLVSDDALTVSALDRTFEHGLGLFETLRTWNGHATLLDRHLARLQHSARELELPLEDAQLPDARAVARLLEASRDQVPEGDDARVRITLSGGLATLPPSGSVLWMSAGPLPHSDLADGAIITRSIEVSRSDPLARHKTLNYWGKRIAMRRAHQAGEDDVLCLTRGRIICETSRSNIFLLKGERLETPALGGPLLPGIMRQVVIERARTLGLEVVEESLPVERIDVADEAFLTNSVRGIVPLERLMDFGFPVPGRVTFEIWNDVRRWLESGGCA